MKNKREKQTMKDCKESTQGMEEGIETKGKYESNQNII
jgi:hypothetical protein